MSPTQYTVEEVAADLQTLPEKEPQPASTTAQLLEAAPAIASKPKRPKPRYRELRVNLADLTAAADHLGIDTASKSGYQALLDRVLLTIPNLPTQQATPDPNQLLAPLLQELAAIKQQVSAGQAGEELEQLQQQVEQQQHEIDRLHAELEKANNRLRLIVSAAQGDVPQQLVSSSQSAPTQPIAAPTPPQPTSSPPAPQPPLPQRSLPRSRPAGKLSPSDRVPLAIVALLEHNQNCPPADRWYLSGNVIAIAAGANPALVVTPWLQSHPEAANQIEQHNSAIGLNARSNGKDKDRGQLKSIYERFVEGKSIEDLRQIARQFE